MLVSCVQRSESDIHKCVRLCVFGTHYLGMFKQHLEVKEAFLKKLKIGLLYDLAILLLSIYPPKIENKDKNRY